MLTINNTEEYEYYLDISLFENTSPKITVNIENNIPTISIDIKVTGRISNIKNGINYSDNSTELDLEKISSVVDKSLENHILTYLNKTQKEFKCDIDGFYSFAKHNFWTIQEWKNYDWASKYKKAKFNVSIESRIYYSLLNSD